MILFNKLVRVDLILAIAVILLLIVRAGSFWQGFLQGAIAVMLIISVVNHIDHYKQTKKIY
jgi:hypothetical protein